MLNHCTNIESRTKAALVWPGLQVAWGKFINDNHILLNKHDSFILRLKLLRAVVSPAKLANLDKRSFAKTWCKSECFGV